MREIVELCGLSMVTTELRALRLLKRSPRSLHIRRTRCGLGSCGTCQ